MGFGNGNFIAEEVAPTIQSAQYKGKYVRFDDSSITLLPTRRVPGAEILRFGSDYGTDEYEIFQDAIAYELPKEVIRTSGVTGVNLDMRAMRQSRYMHELRREFDLTQLIFNPAVYASTNKITLTNSGATNQLQLNDPSSDIEAIFQNAQTSIFDQTGYYPTVTVMSLNAFQAIQRHPVTKDKFKYYQNSSNLQAQADAIAAAYGLGKLLIATAAYRVAGASLTVARTKMVTNQIWMGYVPQYPETPESRNDLGYGSALGHPEADMATPAALYTFALEGEVLVAEPVWYEEENRCYYYPTISNRTPIMTQATAAYLISSVTA
jgi:hypothetical protein